MKQKLSVTSSSRSLLALLLTLSTLFTAVPVLADGKVGGSLTCTTQNNQVWDLKGASTDANMQPVVSLYQGSTYIQHYTTSANNVQVSTQVAAQTADQVYALYNSADNSGPILAQATCTAKTVAVTPAPQPVAPAAPATTSTPTAKTTTPTTATPATTSPTTPADTTTTTPAVTSSQPSQKSTAEPATMEKSPSTTKSPYLTGAVLSPLIVAGLLSLFAIVSYKRLYFSK